MLTQIVPLFCVKYVHEKTVKWPLSMRQLEIWRITTNCHRYLWTASSLTMMGIKWVDISTLIEFIFPNSVSDVFLSAIEQSCDISLVENFPLCAFGLQRRDSGNTNTPQNPNAFRRQSRQREQGCSKCGETNHPTYKCRHNDKIRCHFCGRLGHKQSKCRDAWDAGNVKPTQSFQITFFLF